MALRIVPVILAGGTGTRLWPLSRALSPKQFLKLIDDESLFQKTLLRIKDANFAEPPFIITNENHFFLCRDQVTGFVNETPHYILEPFGRNTAPAIAIAAAALLDHYQEDVIMLVLPSDHLIGEHEAFLKVVTHGFLPAQEGYLITFGITPTQAKTGYGYIETAETISPHCFHIARFIEKPNSETATALINQGNVLWNSGMFMFSAQTFLNELQQCQSETFNATQHAYQSLEKNSDFYRIDGATFAEVPDISIDYAVMEHTQKAVVIPFTGGWNDLGSWTAVAEASTTDENNNMIRGNVINQGSENCLLNSESGHLIAAIGLKNQIVVSTDDAVLIANKSHAEEVKQLVEQLKANQSSLTKHHKTHQRPWGNFTTIAQGKNFQVNHVIVKPHAKIRMQRHQHRTEHWVVVNGTAEVINGNETLTLLANQSTYIPINTPHSLANLSDNWLHVIEVQSGDYIGADDIERITDHEIIKSSNPLHRTKI